MAEYKLTDPALGIPWKGDDIATKTLQDLLFKMRDGSRIKVNQPGDERVRLVLDEPLDWSDKVEHQFVTPYKPSSYESWSPSLEYIGPPTDRFLSLDRLRWCKFKGFRVDGGQARCVIDVDGYTPGHIGTRCSLRNLLIDADARTGDDWVGVGLSRTAMGNQEYHKLKRVFIHGRGLGRGIHQGPSANVKHTRLINCELQGLGIGYDSENGGFVMHFTNFTANRLNWRAQDMQNACSEYIAMSEHSERHAELNGSGAFTSIGSRIGVGSLDPNGGSAWLFHHAALVTQIGTSYDSPPPDGATIYKGTVNRHHKMVGCYYSGTGCTMAQVGLKMAEGIWCEEGGNIIDKPFGAYRITSTSWADGTADWSTAIALGRDPTQALRFKGHRMHAVTLPPGETLRPHKREWREFRAPGLTPYDDVSRYDLTPDDGDIILSQIIPDRDKLRIRFVNPTARTAAQPHGLLILKLSQDRPIAEWYDNDL